MTTADTTQRPTFADLSLSPHLLTAIEKLGFTEPTPIQAEAIGPLMAGRDVIGRARTGSGKTAAFGLPLLERIQAHGAPRRGGVRALVLAPTRELALQVSDALRSYAADSRVEVLTIYGGASYRPQLDGLRNGVPIVVGTPGRLIDHLERGNLDLSGVEMVVLDEADEMLRMGFIEDVETLLGATPTSRQVALFSATMQAPIRRIARNHLHEPIELQVESSALTVDHIEQRYLCVPQRFKFGALVRLLRSEPRDATLIFARTRAGSAELADSLCAEGFTADALHGDLSQGAREQVLDRLREDRIRIVVATDVAARGIDIDHISHVVNYDLPGDIETYVHRIGRTGRAGRHGVALTLVRPNERGFLRALQRQVGAKPVEVEVPSDAEISRSQRAVLQRALADARIASEDRGHDLEGAAEAICEETGWTAEELAAAALGLLARERNIDLRPDIDDQAPHWGRRRRSFDDRRDDRHDSSPKRGRSKPRGRSREGQRAEGGGRNHGDATQEAAVFLATGRKRGLRPADVVGALTNGVGMVASAIGRITILEHKTFVEMPQEAAEALVANVPELYLRGDAVRLAMAHPGSLEHAQGPRDDHDARGRRPKGRSRSSHPGQHRADRGHPSGRGPRGRKGRH